MKYSRVAPVAAALCMVGLFVVFSSAPAPVQAQAAPDSEGFEPLFNGKDLTGWKGDPRLWSVEDGTILGSTEGVEIEHNTFLSTEKSYSDFVLRVKVKLRNHNSGIQFRSEQRDDYVVAGYQADVAEQTYFGMLYEEKLRSIMPYWNEYTQEERDKINGLAKAGDWNEYEITCQGDKITMVLNGYTTCDIVDPDGAKEGIIALQLHTGAPMKVYFKDLYIKDLAKGSPADSEDSAGLIPDFDDEVRRERLAYGGPQYRTPEGFSVEEVATHELIGSVINMTFDHLGRPVVSAERAGVRILVDEDGDGHYESQKTFCEEVSTAMGLHFLAPGDLLVQGNGPQGAGMYRCTDTDGDDLADVVKLLGISNSGMGEHGPHAIEMGADGFIYAIYGNHSHPGFPLEPGSPLPTLGEDHLLERYVDPRGHATSVRAPGGTIQRIDPDTGEWSEIVGGFRNAFDFGINLTGELFTFDADMEWDRGLPWYRPIRIVHAIPGADYGWRTGSSKKPFYYVDTLPSVNDLGRGSPVGVCFYHHNVYPEKYRGAFFTGDWSRGRIRVTFLNRNGATYDGQTDDFVVGEPLNVTDMDVGPDGFLYYTVGGRQTHGGLFRITYDTTRTVDAPADPLETVLAQPMHRSAWGTHAWNEAKTAMGDEWQPRMTAAARDVSLPVEQRLLALEALQRLGPQPNMRLLSTLAGDNEPLMRGAAVLLLGIQPIARAVPHLKVALSDADPYVARRACEALVRCGLNPKALNQHDPELASKLLATLDRPDRFLRYAARNAIQRVDAGLWREAALELDLSQHPHAAIEALLALAYVQRDGSDSDAIFTRLQSLADADMPADLLLDYLRVVQLAAIRDLAPTRKMEDEKIDDSRAAFKAHLGSRLLALFPHADPRVNSELQVLLAYTQPKGAVPAMLAYLTPDKSQEDQIHTVYCLRGIKNGWTPAQRTALVDWFDRGREMAGAASMEGYVNNLWNSSMELLPEDERQLAEVRKEEALRQRAEKALALQSQMNDVQPATGSDLAQMSFEELAEYLEYDPMAYNHDLMDHGKLVFMRSKCADCHVFGAIGKGGGPDLSTVVSRFRRRDILESIVYPSNVVSDQYTAVELELDDFTDVTGMVAGENDDTLTVITVLGERVEVAKSQIVSRKVAEQSVMPEGLLTTMNMGDLVALMNFLELGGEVSSE